MLLQVTRDFPGLPDPTRLTSAQIRFFYNGVRHELKELTKPKS